MVVCVCLLRLCVACVCFSGYCLGLVAWCLRAFDLIVVWLFVIVLLYVCE